MKKSLIAIILIAFTVPAFSQKSYLDKVADSTCKCMEAGKNTVKTESDLDKLGERCIMKSALPFIDSFAKEEGLKVDEIDSEFGNKVGQKIGMKLLTSCPVFVELMATFSSGTDDEEIITGKITGTVTDVTMSDHVYLNIKESNGKITKLTWIEYFPGADDYKASPARLKGKQVEAEWQQTEIYNVSKKDFVGVKVVRGLRVK